ncbi:MAG: DNA polymerase III subunit delta' [Rickettsiales bacterium]|nr:DNA polymerase III subunit delta' [Rickettsiales bacterium]
MSAWQRLIGHQRITQALKRAAENNSPHHAYLMLGPTGIGKDSVAQVFARALLCGSSGERPCDNCSCCRNTLAGSHLDLLSLAPEPPSRNISVGQVRELQRQLAYRQAGVRFRVVMINPAGALGVDAQNKLLKTLEEPPAQTVLILCALHPGQLLPTVRSRCQKLNFGPVASEEIEAWLVAQHDTAQPAAERAANAARGLPGRALELSDPELDEARSQRLGKLVACIEGDSEAIEQLLALVRGNREESELSLELLEELIRDAAVRASGATTRPYHSEVQISHGPLTLLGLPRLSELVDDIEVARGRLRRSVDSSALVEDFLLRLHGGAA